MVNKHTSWHLHVFRNCLSLICSSFSVHVTICLFVSQSSKEKKMMLSKEKKRCHQKFVIYIYIYIYHKFLMTSLFLFSSIYIYIYIYIYLGSQNTPPHATLFLRWVTIRWRPWQDQSRVLNQAYLVTPNSLEEMVTVFCFFGVGFYGILTFVGYLIPNPVYTYILNIYDL